MSVMKALLTFTCTNNLLTCSQKLILDRWEEGTQIPPHVVANYPIVIWIINYVVGENGATLKQLSTVSSVKVD